MQIEQYRAEEALGWCQRMFDVGWTPVPLSALDNSLVCPVRVWQEYTAQFPGYVHSPSTPLLLATGGNKGAIVLASQLRAMFYRVTTALDQSHRRLTPHSLRRGGPHAVLQQRFRFIILMVSM